MTSSAVPLTQGTVWNALREHYEASKAVHMRELFEKAPGRGVRLVCDAQGSYLDDVKTASRMPRCACCSTSPMPPACAPVSTRCSTATRPM